MAVLRSGVSVECLCLVEPSEGWPSEIQRTLEKNVGAHIAGTDSFGAGALAQATQIKPLNDVDVVVRTPHAPQSWIDNPLQAMLDVKSWIENDIRGVYELSTHAIKITFPDEEFTADVVVGVKREGKGIHLPHCPKDEPQRWIESDPAGDPESQGLATPESDSRNGRATAPGRRDRRTG